METVLRRAFVLSTLLCGCRLLDTSFEGTACDDTHPCPQGLTCGTGVCQQGAVGMPISFIEDDFEDAGFARWFGQHVESGDSVSIVSAAAHRGDAGFRSIDTRTVSSGEFEAFLVQHYSAYAGDMYFRGWLRVDSATGESTEVLKSEEPTFSFGQWDVNWYPNGSVRVGAWESQSKFQDALSDAGTVPLNAWHLIEVAWRGAQTPDASIGLFVDGVSAAQIEHFSGVQQSGGIDLGAFFQEHQDTTATVDWDDVRMGSTPNGDTLAAFAPGPIADGTCNSIEVRLLDVFGDVRPAPFDFELVSEGTLYSDAICAKAGAIFPAGEGRQIVYTRMGNTVTIRNVDFLSAPLVVESPGCGCSGGGASLAVVALAMLVLLRRQTR